MLYFCCWYPQLTILNLLKLSEQIVLIHRSTWKLVSFLCLLLVCPENYLTCCKHLLESWQGPRHLHMKVFTWLRLGEGVDVGSGSIRAQRKCSGSNQLPAFHTVRRRGKGCLCIVVLSVHGTLCLFLLSS